MNPTPAQLRQLQRDNLRWPVTLARVPWEQWPPVDGDTPEALANRYKVFRSRQFLVQCFQEANGIVRLSVNRTEWDHRHRRFRADISWDDLQRLKAEAGFGQSWAVEVFPTDDRVVNVANMRHIWILPEAPAFAWNRTRAEARAA